METENQNQTIIFNKKEVLKSEIVDKIYKKLKIEQLSNKFLQDFKGITFQF